MITKTIKVIVFLILITSYSYAQIRFEKGYFTDSKNNKIECLIKNYDWRINPSQIEYKLSENETPNTLNVEDINEFGVYNSSKYIKKTVKADSLIIYSSTPDNHFNPQWTKANILLKVLIEGKASLYSYTAKNKKLYFFDSGSSPTQQLIYKEEKGQDNQIRINYGFRQQLLNHVNCNEIPDWAISRISYTKKELLRHFTKYNNYQNEEYVNFETKNNSKSFHLTLTPGINYSSLAISTEQNILANTKEAVDFDKKLTFRIGAELEFVLPVNKGKWSIVIEPNYQQYCSNQELTTQSVSVNYKALELPFGLRHYFFLDDNSKVYINAFIAKAFSLNSEIDFERSQNDLEVSSGFNAAFGIGYAKNKLSAELRAYTPRNITNSHIYWESKYNNVSFIIGYRLF